MKAIRRNLKETSKYSLFILIAIFVLIFVLNKIFVTKIKNNIIKYIDNINNNYINLEYEDINVSCFPYIIKVKILSPKMTIDGNDKKIEISAENIMVKNVISTKNFSVILPDKINIDIDEENKNEITLENHYLNFKLNKDYTLSDFDSFVQNLTIENIDNSDVIILMKNLGVKIIGIASNEYKNRTFRINIDSLIKKNLKKNIETESNFELVISNLKEFDSNNDIIVINNLIDTLSFNDVTNNYAFRLNGNYNADKLTKNLNIDLDLEVANYNSLISALNNKNDEYFLDKSRISDIIQILELIPNNSKDTKSNRYYKIIGDLSNKALFLNDKSINDIIKQIFYKNNF